MKRKHLPLILALIALTITFVFVSIKKDKPTTTTIDVAQTEKKAIMEKKATAEKVTVVEKATVVEKKTIEEKPQPAPNDDVPTFMYYIDKDNMKVVYWSQLDNTEETDDSYKMQQSVQANAQKYTKMIIDNKVVDVKFLKEELKDNDGYDLNTGMVSNNLSMLSGLTYGIADDNIQLKSRSFGTMYPLVTEDFINNHQLLPIKSKKWKEEENDVPFSNEVVGYLENEYGMKCKRSHIVCQVEGGFTFGILQFEVKDEKVLALKVLVDEDKIYSLPDEGHYYEGEATWNVDDCGVYLPFDIINVFDGPEGIVICFEKCAPESYTTGIMSLKDGKLIEQIQGMYYVLVN